MRLLALAALGLLTVVTNAAAADRLSVKVLGVARGPDTTVVSYALTNREPHVIDYVRVACDLSAGRRGVVDQGVEINEDLGAGETVQGSIEFNSDEVFRGRRFRCRVAAAYMR